MNPGIYAITEEEYHKDPCPTPSLSRSIIKDLLFDCPFRAWLKHPRLNPDYEPEEDSVKFDLGTSAHQILLEGTDKVIALDFDDWRKKEAKEQRDQAREQGLIPLLTDQYAEVLVMVEAAKQQIRESKLPVNDLQIGGKPEQSVVWKENDTWLRVRPDWLREDKKMVIDYKTTGLSANPEGLDRHIISMGYDIQAAFYSRGLESVTGIKPEFFFIFQETTKPYLCSFIGLHPDLIKMGQQKVDYGIFLWEKCLKENNWPAYPKEIAYIEAPSWSLAKWEQIAVNIC
jgi:hypothetical protein